MHAYDRSLVNITSLIPCLVSINSSSGDLIESVYYMLIPMQHISVLRIFISLYINIQSSSYVNYHAWRQIPLFHQGSSSAGSEPEPSFKPVLCFSTPKAPAPNQEKRFLSSTKTLLG